MMVTPLCADGSWKTPGTREDTVYYSGGFSNDVFVLQALDTVGKDPATGDHKSFRFIDVCKNKKWFLKMVGGDKCSIGDLKHVKVFDRLAKAVK